MLDEKEKNILKELYVLVHSLGMWDYLTVNAQDYALSSEELSNCISGSDPINLEPRISLDEFRSFIMRSNNVPSTQYDFYDVMAKIAHLAIMIEKNPLLSQEIKGINQVQSSLTDYFKA
jgi:hypothetical protein